MTTPVARFSTCRMERLCATVTPWVALPYYDAGKLQEIDMKKSLLTPIIALLFSLTLTTGCVVTTDDSTLTIVNESSYVLVDIRVTERNAFNWGRNLVGGSGLYPGESLTVSLYCDVYDARVVDQDGFTCELYGLDLCFNDAVWVIDNFELNTCDW
jgi:hypothetical protein